MLLIASFNLQRQCSCYQGALKCNRNLSGRPGMLLWHQKSLVLFCRVWFHQQLCRLVIFLMVCNFFFWGGGVFLLFGQVFFFKTVRSCQKPWFCILRQVLLQSDTLMQLCLLVLEDLETNLRFKSINKQVLKDCGQYC